MQDIKATTCNIIDSRPRPHVFFGTASEVNIIDLKSIGSGHTHTILV